jgi:hypothetical protein
MNIKSKQFLFSILAGMIVGLLVSIFLTPTCWGAVIGVFVAAYMAKVSSPKEGAIVGAIVLVPIAIYGTIQTAFQTNVVDEIGIFTTILVFLLVVVLISGIDALYGLVIGKLFQLTKDKKLIL